MRAHHMLKMLIHTHHTLAMLHPIGFYIHCCRNGMKNTSIGFSPTSTCLVWRWYFKLLAHETTSRSVCESLHTLKWFSFCVCVFSAWNPLKGPVGSCYIFHITLSGSAPSMPCCLKVRVWYLTKVITQSQMCWLNALTLIVCDYNNFNSPYTLRQMNDSGRP